MITRGEETAICTYTYRPSCPTMKLVFCTRICLSREISHRRSLVICNATHYITILWIYLIDCFISSVLHIQMSVMYISCPHMIVIIPFRCFKVEVGIFHIYSNFFLMCHPSDSDDFALCSWR